MYYYNEDLIETKYVFNEGIVPACRQAGTGKKGLPVRCRTQTG
jgi:hypothetical protein